MSDDSDGFAALLLGSGVFVFLGWVIDRGVRFGARLIVAQGFGKIDYGVISLGATMLAMGSTFALLGLHAGVSRYLPRDESPVYKRGVILSGAQIVGPVALLVGLTVILFAEPLGSMFLGGPEHAPVIQVFGVGIPLATVVKFAINVVRGQQHTDAKVVIENVVIPVVQFGGIAVAYVVTSNRLGVAWAYTISYAIAAVLALHYLRKHTPVFERVGATYRRRELLTFSFPLLFTSVMFMFLTDIDTAMLGYFDTSTAIAEYNVAYPISFLLLVILESFAFLFVPVLSELHSDQDLAEMASIYQLVTKWVIFLTTPLFMVVILYPRKIISLTFGEAYTPAAVAMVILSIGFYLRAIAGPNGATLTAIGKTRLHFYDTTVATLLNVLLNLVLIPRFSYLGAAIATVASYVVLNVLYSYQVYAETDILPVSSRLSRPLFGIVVISAIAYAASGTPSAPWEIIALLIGYAIAFAGIIVFLGGIGPDELVLLDSAEERLDIDLAALKRLLE